VEIFFQQWASDPFQVIATGIILIIFVCAVFGVRKKEGWLAPLAAIAPNILVSVGIFFTFLGIFISLRNFDIRAIDNSIPRLLDGLKLAFLSSVVGLGSSVVFRFIQACVNRAQSAGEIGAAHINEQLRQLNANTLAVRDALVGEGEASLSTQFAKLRNDFRDFADRMKEDGTQALIKALEEVIKDFNEKISEQFGENFKQLNEAVGALLEWQKEYRAQVEALTQAFKETQTGIEKIEQTVAKIPDHMQSIESAFTATETRIEQLYEGIGSLSDMRKSAENAVPELQKSIESMTAGLRDIQSRIEQSVADNVEAMNQGLQKLDQGTQQQIQRVMDRMGNNLISITEKFVTTYEENARKIAELTKLINQKDVTPF